MMQIFWNVLVTRRISSFRLVDEINAVADGVAWTPVARYAVRHSRRRRTSIVQRPLLPNYAFVLLQNMPPNSKIPLLLGRFNVLRVNTEPVVVSESDLLWLRKMDQKMAPNSEDIDNAGEKLHRGDRVTILHGPFSGHEAVVLAIFKHSVAIEVVNNSLKFRIAPFLLRKVQV